MNKKQKVVVLLGVITLIAMIVYPPWIEFQASYSSRGVRYTSIEYRFIYKPPKKIGAIIGFSLDKTRLTFQIVGVILSTFGFCLVFCDKKKVVTDTSQLS